MTVLAKSRAQAVRARRRRRRRDAGRRSDGRGLALPDGASARCPNTGGLGLEEAGVALDARRLHHRRPRLAHDRRAGIYAAGDCTGVLMLASVAAMQGRIAMWHALGDAVAPLKLQARWPSNVFTDPEIATVGITPARGRRR